MPNLNRLRYEPYALVAPQVAASILRNATQISLSGGGGASCIPIPMMFGDPAKSALEVARDPRQYSSEVVGAGTVTQKIEAMPFDLVQSARPYGVKIYQNSMAVSPSELTVSIRENSSTATFANAPGAELVKFSVLDLSSSTGYRWMTAPSMAPLSPGIYWLSYHLNGNSASVQYLHVSYIKNIYSQYPPTGVGRQLAVASGYSLSPTTWPPESVVQVQSALNSPQLALSWIKP